MAKKVTKKSTKSKSKMASKPAKKVVTKKVAPKSAKKPAKKGSPKKIESKKPVIATIVEPAAPAPVIAPVPNRAPVRRIIGTDKSITIVSKEAPKVENTPQPTTDVVVLEKPKTAPTPTALPKTAWNEVSKNVPAHIRFILVSAMKECELAASSPFPFAKFISSLPQQICGTGLALSLLNLENRPEKIAIICKMAHEKVLEYLSNCELDLAQQFSANCPEIDRKWRARLGGAERGIESMIEGSLIAKVEKTFQFTIASLILQALGVKNDFDIEQTENTDAKAVGF